MTFPHLDETGEPCVHHPAVPLDEVLVMALTASRRTGFHHHLASKLQGLTMAIHEVVELSENGEEALKEAGDSASQALREILDLLTPNRALTKVPVKVAIAAGDLCDRALERVRASFTRPLPPVTVELSVPLVVQALALAFDVAGGSGRSRAIDVNATTEGAHLVMSLALPAELTVPAGRALGLAAFGLTREGGGLRCSSDGTRMVIRLPLAS